MSLYAVPDYSINTPLLIEGSLPAGGREMAISDVFARAHGLSPGDFYTLTVTGTDLDLRLQISGLIKSVECVKHVNASTPTPELDRYAFAYVTDSVLSALTGENQYNQICVTVSEGTDDDALRAEIDRRLGDKVVNILARKDNLAVNMLKRSTDDLTPVLHLFPILFFLCAVLLMVSNMSRLIEGARTTIGTFKALGYGDGTILWYYLLHAVLVVAVGFPLGVLPVKPLIRLIVETLATGNDLPAYAIVYDYGAAGYYRCVLPGQRFPGDPIPAEGEPGPVHASQTARKHQARAAGAPAALVEAVELQSEVHRPEHAAQ